MISLFQLLGFIFIPHLAKKKMFTLKSSVEILSGLEVHSGVFSGFTESTMVTFQAGCGGEGYVPMTPTVQAGTTAALSTVKFRSLFKEL